MAVVITLTRKGQKKLPFYRIVAKEKGTKRDGKFIEILGTYNPLKEPAEINIKEDRVKHWIENGANPTSIVESIIKKSIPSYWEAKLEERLKRKQELRKKRKARAKKAA